MPVEIKELIIRATIVNNNSSSNLPSVENSSEKSEIIAACVAQVLKILERKKAR